VTKDNQSTIEEEEERAGSSSHVNVPVHSSFVNDISPLSAEIQIFSSDRNWDQFHTPRNIILALLGEVGELAELVQWKGDNNEYDNECEEQEEPLFTTTELDKLSQELADVTIYLLRLANVCDLTSQLHERVQQEQEQYAQPQQSPLK
jgi:dCTP diphosphatase